MIYSSRKQCMKQKLRMLSAKPTPSVRHVLNSAAFLGRSCSPRNIMITMCSSWRSCHLTNLGHQHKCSTVVFNTSISIVTFFQFLDVTVWQSTPIFIVNFMRCLVIPKGASERELLEEDISCHIQLPAQSKAAAAAPQGQG